MSESGEDIKKVKEILHGIHIGYMSDMDIAASIKYPCFLEILRKKI